MQIMILRIDHHSGVPAYKQLVDQVLFQISSGQLKAGDEMPSTRSLSVKLDLNPMTISKAYSQLQREGALERRKGKPLLVKALEEADQESNKLEQMKRSLASSVSVAKQLGVSKTEAARIFRELFDENI